MAFDPMDALDPEAKPATRSPVKAAKSSDPMDALDTPTGKHAPDQPGPILAEWYEEPPKPVDTADRPKYLGELPPQVEGRLETNPETGRKEWVEGKGKIRAEFTDQPEAGKVSAQGLARAHEDTMRKGRQALAGGALQGATFGFADELEAAAERAKNIVTGDPAKAGKTYSQIRDENRRAFSEAEAGDRSAYNTGHLAGGAATMLVPGVNRLGAMSNVKYAAEVARLMRMGKTAGEAAELARVPLLSGRGVATGTAYGGLQAAGESTADVASGDPRELGKFGIDVAKGGVAGGAATTALGLAGKGVTKVKNWVATAPERQASRADDALWSLLTQGVDKAKREELAGVLGSDRGSVLEMARSNPAFMEALRVGDRAKAADMVLAAAPEVAARKEAAIAASEAKTPGSKKIYGQAIVAEMEKRRDALRATPTPDNMAAADKWQKRIDALNEKWMPAPKLKGEALASRLTANADRGTIERAASNAAEFGKVAEKYKLGQSVNNLPERQKKIGDALEVLNGKTSAIYDRVGGKAKEESTNSGITLYRAAKDEDVTQGMSFATDLDTAKAYLDNPGFGGSKLFKTTINPNPKTVLDTRGMTTEELAEKLDMRDPGAIGIDEWLPRTQRALDAARDLGYKWAIVNESYPSGATTWQYLGNIEDIEPTLSRVRSSAVNAVAKKPPKQDVYTANVSGKLREWADELRRQRGGLRAKDAENVDAFAANLAQDAALNGPTMTAKELRNLITDVQGKAFAGSYIDPTEARSMQRELAGKLREVLDAHVAQHGRPSDVKKLAELNKEISALITFQESAEREGVEAFRGLHKAAPSVAQDARNGRATVQQLYRLIQATDDPEAKRVLTGELYRQIGPEATKRLTGIEREESLLERLGTVTKAGAEQHAGDSERGKRLGHLFDRHHPLASVIAKYGDAIADKANKYAVKAENLRRRGASNQALAALGKAMGLGEDVTAEIIGALAPREAGALAGGGK